MVLVDTSVWIRFLAGREPFASGAHPETLGVLVDAVETESRVDDRLKNLAESMRPLKALAEHTVIEGQQRILAGAQPMDELAIHRGFGVKAHPSSQTRRLAS